MADSTPDAAQPDATPAKKAGGRKPAAKKSPAKTPATKPTVARSSAVPAPATATDVDSSAPETTPADGAPAASSEPSVTTASAVAATGPEASAPPAGSGGSFLDRVRANRMGPLTAGLLVALAVGLLLSVLVPNRPSALAMMVLGALLTAAVGFTVRYLSDGADLRRQVEAFIAATLGIHIMSVTGAVGGELPLVSQFGIDGPGFNEALIAAMATPPVSAGGVLAGVAAAIIVGWGAGTGRTPRR